MERHVRSTARAAGLLYLATVVTGMFYLAYVPSRLAAGDAGSKIALLLQSQTLFRLGIAGELACNVAFLLLPLALYRLLSPAGRNAATLMVAFALPAVPIAFVNAQHHLDVLGLLADAARHGPAAGQWQAQVMQQLDAHRHGLLVLQVFWGLWLLPFGYLVFMCGFLPRLLGVLLVLGGLGYLLDFLATLLMPSYPGSAVADYVLLPASLGEIGTCLWLLVVGARAPTRLPTAPA